MEKSVQFKAHRKLRRARADSAVSILEKLDAVGMTPEQIAEALGVSQRSVYRWGHRESTPQPSHLTRMQELLSRKE